jgi:hypothetical protein
MVGSHWLNLLAEGFGSSQPLQLRLSYRICTRFPRCQNSLGPANFSTLSKRLYLNSGPDVYNWALVSGGLPKNEGQDGYCKTGEGINNSGLWIFTREKMASPETVDTIRGIAKGLGYDTSVLLPVDQDGCLFTDIQNA